MTSTSKKKGPAEAATSPDHGSPNPTQERPMNMDSNTTAAAIPATLTATISTDQMIALPPNVRQALYDAFQGAGAALHGVLLQPRCHRGDEEHVLNPGGEMISQLLNFFDDARSALVEASKLKPEPDAIDNDYRLFLILRHYASEADSVADVAAMASSFVVQQRECEFAARRNQRRAA